MNSRADAAEVSALIEDILARYHEPHRRDLAAILALARDESLRAPFPHLEERLADFAEALEMHMLKEEMRLFPMMEQGGHGLVRHLIDDLRGEHGSHREALGDLESLRRALDGAAGVPGAQPLAAALGRLSRDLEDHIRAEDEGLFPRFEGAGTAPPAPRPG